MNRAFLLLVAGLLGLCLALNGTLARDFGVIVVGFLAAVVVGLAAVGGLCFLTRCRVRATLAAVREHCFPHGNR